MAPKPATLPNPPASGGNPPNGLETDLTERVSLRARMSDSVVHEDILDLADRLVWYALLVPPSREFVAQKILRRYGLRTFVPVSQKWRKLNRFSVEKELQAYAAAPRYVFAGFDAGVPLWFNLFQLPLISGVVGIGKAPKRIPNACMRKLIRKTGYGLNAPDAERYMRTHREFTVGDEVDVVDGPFAGIRAPVVQIVGNRAAIAFSLFGGAVDELDVPIDFLQAA